MSAVYPIKQNFTTDIHCVPLKDIIDHPCDVNCPCHPFHDEENAKDLRLDRATGALWIHRRIQDQKDNVN